MADAVLEFAIIGAGFGGLAMARALDRAGVAQYCVFEKADEIGGTWRDNTYPGAACDVPSHLYSLSDAPRSDWSRLFPEQAELLRYLLALAAPLRAAGRIVCGARLVHAQWQPEPAHWSLRFADGRHAQARHLVLALGGLHQPAWPDIPGRDTFRGPVFHTARWDHGVVLRGQRVAVIGTGASAVQVIPAIIDQVKTLHVLQRTPGWVMPRPDQRVPAWLQAALARVPGLRLALRGALFLWLEALSHGLLMPRSAFWARWMARRHLRRQIAEPELRQRLTPHYPIGCKRVLISSDYYPALARAHCTLETTPIERITPTGLRLADGRALELDVIVCASGFRPMDVLNEVTILGRDGRRLDHDWRERPSAHLGISVHGYPNLAFLLGPNTALGHNSVLTMIESQVRHVLAQRALRITHGARSIEPTATAQQAFVAALDRRFATTAWAGGCHSWYLDAVGRNIALWVGSVLAYRRRTRRIDAREYLLDGTDPRAGSTPHTVARNTT